MRTSIALVTGALLLTPAALAAQTQPAAPATSPVVTGWFDFGGRGTSREGDGARFERYRDLGDGLFLESVRLGREAGRWALEFSGDHVGRRDQRLTARFDRPGQLKTWVEWDQIPMLMSTATRTLFNVVSPGVLQIDDALQSQVQASAAALPNLFNLNARTFDTKSRRHSFDTGVEYLATTDLTLKLHARRTDREGVIPYGGSFGHGSLVEPPAPVNHTLTDVDAGAEFARDAVLFRAGYTASLFNNEQTTLTFDNPFRLTDVTGTSGRGRLSLPPSSSFFGVNGLASVKLPRRSRASAYVSIGSLSDAGDPIMPQTINSANVTAPLDRANVEGEARTNAVNLTFTSSPTRAADFSLRYRVYEYDNRTPEFALTQRVSYDNTPSTLTTAVHTEPFSVTRRTFDADARATPTSFLAAGIGFSRLSEDRNHRIFETTNEDVVRVTVDSVGHRWFTVRGRYEHSEKRGEGLDETLLSSIGEQPALRHFDLASRNRDRFTLLASLTPLSMAAVNLSVATGEDDYFGSVFGLRDNSHRVYSLGMDLVPSERTGLHWSYSFERYKALSRSRQANPPTVASELGCVQVFPAPTGSRTCQITDPSRNWATDATDRAHSFFLNGEIAKIGGKLDMQVSYDFSRARAFYNYIVGAVVARTLPPELVVPTTLPEPTQLPPTLSELHRGVINGTYWVTSKVGLGLSYWYENYKVDDFTLDEDANRDLARGQVLLVGYFYRPYTANTVWGRLIVVF